MKDSSPAASDPSERGADGAGEPAPSVREYFNHVREAVVANQHQREMPFLRQLMLYDSTGAATILHARLAKAERNERCALRAVWLMTFLTAVAAIGLGYAMFLQQPPHPGIWSFCVLGVASVISLVVFGVFWRIFRTELDHLRECCRELVTKIVESRIGKPMNIIPDVLTTGRSPGAAL